MWEFVTSRGTCSDHRVPTSFTRTEPPLNQFSRLVMLGLWPGGEIPCLADDLSAIGWDQVALTVTRPNGAARRLLPRRDEGSGFCWISTCSESWSFFQLSCFVSWLVT